jgi:hypothetical protein
MIQAQEGKYVALLPVANDKTNAITMSFDRSGFDYAEILLMVGSHATTTTVIETLKITESDTATAATSMTDIVPLTGGTATSTSAGFVIPVVTTAGKGGVVPFFVDLRKRKKYVGVVINGTAATAIFSGIAKLTRGTESADTAAEKAGVNLAATTAQGCMTVVTA